MRNVRRTDTAPELITRRVTHRLGYRYRLHNKKLPGSPDIVFSSRKSIIFVHGCFWHGHENCKLARIPKSNSTFWRQKIQRNRARDTKVISELSKLGWKTLIVWECKTKNTDTLAIIVKGFLDSQ